MPGACRGRAGREEPARALCPQRAGSEQDYGVPVPKAVVAVQRGGGIRQPMAVDHEHVLVPAAGKLEGNSPEVFSDSLEPDVAEFPGVEVPHQADFIGVLGAELELIAYRIGVHDGSRPARTRGTLREGGWFRPLERGPEPWEEEDHGQDRGGGEPDHGEQNTATTEIYTALYTLSLHDALPIFVQLAERGRQEMIFLQGGVILQSQ